MRHARNWTWATRLAHQCSNHWATIIDAIGWLGTLRLRFSWHLYCPLLGAHIVSINIFYTKTYLEASEWLNLIFPLLNPRAELLYSKETLVWPNLNIVLKTNKIDNYPYSLIKHYYVNKGNFKIPNKALKCLCICPPAISKLVINQQLSFIDALRSKAP